MILDILDRMPPPQRPPPLSAVILSQLHSNSLAVFWDPENRILSGRISSLYSPSLQIKMAALNRLSFSLSGLELTRGEEAGLGGHI